MFVFVVLGFQIQVWEGPPEGPDYLPTEQDNWVQLRAQDAVSRVLRVIGHDVSVNRVHARPGGDFVLATYWARHSQITFNSEAIVSQAEFELIAAHECVHAIFDRAGLDADYSSKDWARCQLVEETTAYVLGAHIAGMVRTRQGGDGEALRSKLIEMYREACDWSSPKCRRRELWEKAIKEGEESIDQREAFAIEIHFGSVELINAIDQICRENPDPWKAAHVVAERYIEPIEE